MNNKQESVAPSHVLCRCPGDNAIDGMKGVGVHQKVALQSAQTYSQRHIASVLHGRIQSTKSVVDWFFKPTKAWPKGQFAHLDTAFPRVRESRHGIIRSHRIWFAWLSKGLSVSRAAYDVLESQRADSPKGVLFKRSNMGSRRTGDQNASFV